MKRNFKEMLLTWQKGIAVRKQLFKVWKELVSNEFTFGDMIICNSNWFVQNAVPFLTLQEVLEEC